jgi:hypothetical protein
VDELGGRVGALEAEMGKGDIATRKEAEERFGELDRAFEGRLETIQARRTSRGLLRAVIDRRFVKGRWTRTVNQIKSNREKSDRMHFSRLLNNSKSNREKSHRMHFVTFIE